MRKTVLVVMLAGVLAAAMTMGGCSNKKVKTPASGTTEEAVSSTTGTDSQNAGIGSDSVDNLGRNGPQDAQGQQRIIYFDFDRSDIKPEFVDVIASHGRYAANNPSTKIRLEGHSDERGSREYNIGLAERRAQTVKRALLLQGAQESQIATVSYGEERPAVSDSTEDAYTKNRRVEITYP
ncbi:MAG: peptidoglycan-associated lipoprotein Pal [Steroidobacteraceae bacterium]